VGPTPSGDPWRRGAVERIGSVSAGATAQSGNEPCVGQRCFTELTNKQVRRGGHRSAPELEAATRTFIEAHNADPPRPTGVPLSGASSTAACVGRAERGTRHAAVTERHAANADSPFNDEHRQDRRHSGFGDAESLADLQWRVIAAGQAREDGVIELVPEVMHADMLAALCGNGVTG
jgi:hypothetical protein